MSNLQRRHAPCLDMDQYLITKENREVALHNNIYYHERENHLEEEVGAICSRGRVLKEKHREKEGEILALRHPSAEDSSLPDCSATCCSMDSEDTTSTASANSCLSNGMTHDNEAMTMKTRQLCELSARKKKEVAEQKRKFSDMQWQLKTLKALQTATSRYETLQSSSR